MRLTVVIACQNTTDCRQLGERPPSWCRDYGLDLPDFHRVFSSFSSTLVALTGLPCFVCLFSVVAGFSPDDMKMVVTCVGATRCWARASVLYLHETTHIIVFSHALRRRSIYSILVRQLGLLRTNILLKDRYIYMWIFSTQNITSFRLLSGRPRVPPHSPSPSTSQSLLFRIN